MTVPVSIYPSEFASAPGPYEAVEPSLFLGLSPLLLLLALLAAVAAAAAAYRWGRQGGGGDGRSEDAARDVHAAILADARAAMTAESGELRARVEQLRETVGRVLGPVLDVAKGVDGPVKLIDEALKGERTVEPAPERHDHKPHQPPAAQQPVVNQILIGVSPNAPGAEARGRDDQGEHHEHHDQERPHKPEKPKPEKRPMTAEEQTDALARAARAFHDHWAKPQRIQELRDARRALSSRPPARLKRPDERGRVWEH